MSTERLALSSRLRSETRELHLATEAALGIPESVTSPDDYAQLLATSWAFYAGARDVLADPRWTARWQQLGITLDRHDRVPLLEADLRALGTSRPTCPINIGVDSFAQALGVLYVVEGSSLGGRFIGPAIAQTIGDVPTAFYLGEGRGHPSPWRAVGVALAKFDNPENDVDDVIEGARRAFDAFGATVTIDRELAA